MQTITKRELIKSVAERWKAQYCERGRWKQYSLSPEAKYERLLRLPPDASEDDVEGIIGNGSWTRNGCDECGESSEVTILWEGAALESPPLQIFASLAYVKPLPCVRKD